MPATIHWTLKTFGMLERRALFVSPLIATVFGMMTIALISIQTIAQEKAPARWIPRQSITGETFVGDRACAQCHKKHFASYSQSAMEMAMEPVGSSRVLSANTALTFRNGPYSYSIKRQGKQSLYTVTNGKESVTATVLYAFGQGKAGQTYVFRYQGELYQSLVSFYQEVNGLDFTVGASSEAPASLKEALGRPMSENETKDCFGCHGTGAIVNGKVDFEKNVPGVHCEACHGPGKAHTEAIQSGEPGANLIFNPKRLSGDELAQEFCAACHRAIPDFEKLRSLKVNNVRFQPYRIFYSKCYSDDRRISCTACHNPHGPVKQESAYYDAKCLACHNTAKGDDKLSSTEQKSALTCKVGTKDCVTCHMQKVAPPQAHFKFTDHYIRVIKPGAPYPD